MAGYYDAQGVWMHDETDTFPLTSEVLNRGQRSISDALVPLAYAAPQAVAAAAAAEAAAVLILGEGYTRRQSAQVSTPLIAAGAEWAGVIPLGLSYRLLRISTSHPARARLYASIAQRTADAARPVGTDPDGDHGLILEYVAGPLTATLTPAVDGSNLDPVPVVSIPIRIQNLSAAAAAVQVSFVYLETE